MSFGGGREGLGIPVGGVRGEIDAGQNGKGLVGRSAGGVAGSPPLALVFGKNLSCSADMWQALSRAGARIWLMRSMLTNRFLPSSLEMRTSSTGHFAGGRDVVSLSVCL